MSHQGSGWLEADDLLVRELGRDCQRKIDQIDGIRMAYYVDV